MNTIKKMFFLFFFLISLSFISTHTEENSKEDYTVLIIQCIEEILLLCNNTLSIKEKYSEYIDKMTLYHADLIQGKRITTLAENIQALSIVAQEIAQKDTNPQDQEIRNLVTTLFKKLSEYASILSLKKHIFDKNQKTRTPTVPNNAIIAIGYKALSSHVDSNNYGPNGMAIGNYALASGGAHCGNVPGGAGGIALGSEASAMGRGAFLFGGASGGVAIGNSAFASPQGVALGNNASAGTGADFRANYALAVGTNSQATAFQAITISSWQTGVKNETENSFLLSNNGGTGAATSGISLSDGLGSYFLHPIPTITDISSIYGQYILVIDPTTGKISIAHVVPV